MSLRGLVFDPAARLPQAQALWQGLFERHNCREPSSPGAPRGGKYCYSHVYSSPRPALSSGLSCPGMPRACDAEVCAATFACADQEQAPLSRNRGRWAARVGAATNLVDPDCCSGLVSDCLGCALRRAFCTSPLAAMRTPREGCHWRHGRQCAGQAGCHARYRQEVRGAVHTAVQHLHKLAADPPAQQQAGHAPPAPRAARAPGGGGRPATACCCTTTTTTSASTWSRCCCGWSRASRWTRQWS